METGALLATYTRGLSMGGGIGGLLARTFDGGTSFYHYDGRGNVTGLSDTAGAVSGKYSYDAFGNTLAVSGGAAGLNPYRFSTKEQIGGLVYYGYRFYSTSMGKWINRDPIAEKGGVNIYGFAYNNPVDNIDALGLDVGWAQNPCPNDPWGFRSDSGDCSGNPNGPTSSPTPNSPLIGAVNPWPPGTGPVPPGWGGNPDPGGRPGRGIPDLDPITPSEIGSIACAQACIAAGYSEPLCDVICDRLVGKTCEQAFDYCQTLPYPDSRRCAMTVTGVCGPSIGLN